MEEIIYQRDYAEYKQELRTELEKTSEGFVRIGYLLKVARDTDILKTSGYSDYLDFANGEFGLDKSMVSRFIRINDRFSEEGNSDRLLEQYRGFGYSKLALMLRIPEVITEELSPEYTKAEIQAIKDEIDEEREKSDVEHFEENMSEIMNPPEDSLLCRVLRAIGGDNPEIYCKIWNYLSDANTGFLGVKEIFKPLDQQTYVTRVPGEGKVILIAKEDLVSITVARTETKTQYQWPDVIMGWSEVMIMCTEDGDSFVKAEDAYQATYGKPIEEKKPEVAPVQPKRVEIPDKPKAKKPEKNKYQLEAEEAHKREAEAKQEPEETREAEKEVSEPEKVSGEVIEESGLLKNEESEESKETEEPEKTQSKLDPATIRGYKAGLSSDIRALERMLGNNQYRAFRTKLETMLNTVNRIIDSEEVSE
jgi:hypothetical protein